MGFLPRGVAIWRDSGIPPGDIGVCEDLSPALPQIADHLPTMPLKSFGVDCRAHYLGISGDIALSSLLLYAGVDSRGGRSGAWQLL
jgi:hypothetical protein